MLKLFSQLYDWLERRRIQILPPLRPKRAKPFPQRPHHRRRQAVFAALASAPSNATINELIAHVRSVTGVGCGRKLIVEWKKDTRREKQRDEEIEGQGKTTRQRNLFAVVLLFCLGLSVWNPALNVGAQEITISPAPSQSPNLSNFPSPTSNSSLPRLLRIKLTLNAYSELHIKQGDEVKAGALLTDRTQARRRLLLQKRSLEFAARHLQIQMQLTAESLRQLHSLGLALPPTTFAAERAAIQRAETEAVAVNRSVEIQRQRVSSYESLVSGETDALPSRNPKPETRNLIAAHESAKLTQAQDQQLRAQAEIELHQAKLATAREVRAWEEQKHRVEITRQLLSARSQQQQAEIEVARLSAQIAELDLQLAQLAEVHTPFAGTIKRIEWEEMNDEKITVVVYLVVGSR